MRENLYLVYGVYAILLSICLIYSLLEFVFVFSCLTVITVLEADAVGLRVCTVQCGNSYSAYA